MFKNIAHKVRRLGGSMKAGVRKTLKTAFALGATVLGIQVSTTDASAATYTYDLSAVTGAASDLATDILTGLGVIIPVAIGVAALAFGGRYVWRKFKSFTS